LLTSGIIAQHIGQINGLSTTSTILDACQKWTNLADEIITNRLSTATIIDFA